MNENDKIELAFLRAGVTGSLRRIVSSLRDEADLDVKNGDGAGDNNDLWKSNIPIQVRALWSELNDSVKLAIVGMAMFDNTNGYEEALADWMNNREGK